jgi:hypothetical protein
VPTYKRRILPKIMEGTAQARLCPPYEVLGSFP